jgi:hypothetical protein
VNRQPAILSKGGKLTFHGVRGSSLLAGNALRRMLRESSSYCLMGGDWTNTVEPEQI